MAQGHPVPMRYRDDAALEANIHEPPGKPLWKD